MTTTSIVILTAHLLISAGITFLFSYMQAEELASLTRKQKQDGTGPAIGFFVGVCNAAVLSVVTAMCVSFIGSENVGQAFSIACIGWALGNISVFICRVVLPMYLSAKAAKRKRMAKTTTCKCKPYRKLKPATR